MLWRLSWLPRAPRCSGQADCKSGGVVVGNARYLHKIRIAGSLLGANVQPQFPDVADVDRGKSTRIQVAQRLFTGKRYRQRFFIWAEEEISILNVAVLIEGARVCAINNGTVRWNQIEIEISSSAQMK